LTLQDKAPGATDGDEHAHRELSTRVRAAGDPRSAERARAAARARTADVGVEIVERPRTEEDRMRERPEPGREAGRRSVGPRDRDLQERRRDRVQSGLAVQREAVAVDDDRRGEGGQAFRVIGAGDRDRTEELEVALRPADTGIDVDDDAIASWQRQRELLADPAVC